MSTFEIIAGVVVGVTALYLFYRWNIKGQSWAWRIIMIVAAIVVLAITWGIRVTRHPASYALSSASPTSAATFEAGTALSAVVEREGVVGRRFGSLRVYLAVAPEVRLESKANDKVRSPLFDNPNSPFPTSYVVVKSATREWTVRSEAVPILVVLENDAYTPLHVAKLNWQGTTLCSVRVARLREEGGEEEEVLAKDVPLPERADWWSAERRSIEVPWPLQDASPGDYRVSVQLPFGDNPVVGINTRLR